MSLSEEFGSGKDTPPRLFQKRGGVLFCVNYSIDKSNAFVQVLL